MIRLFVALVLPEECCEALSRMCRGVRDARWIREQSFCLTLRFIGEVGEPRLPEIADALSRVENKNFMLTLSGIGHFQIGRRIRSLWAGTEPCDALVQLQNRVDAALRGAGVPPSGRKFTPHVTLARLKNGTAQQVGPWIEANALFRADPFPVNQFVLFESYLSHTGAIYSPVAEIPLLRGVS
ncbi:RNA 2',3'-cyclic phosphodiesterase [Alphaproteobacteria bacterium]|nr:RNA 2',3'-cyclic phosphodiesterase [Alphaproteobacteria bacterium]